MKGEERMANNNNNTLEPNKCDSKGNDGESPWNRRFVQAKDFLITNFLLVGFGLAIIIALAAPIAGMTVSKPKFMGKKSIVQFINTCIVFLISGLTLKVEDLSSVYKQLPNLSYGIFTINFITTWLAPLFLTFTFISNINYRIGLAIFANVPTTLGVGVALTGIAKGDILLSLVMTVTTNLIGCVTIPFLLDLYLNKITYDRSIGLVSSNESNSSDSFTFNPIVLILDLILTVLIPTLVGIGLRLLSKGVVEWTKAYKTELSLFSTTNLICIIWMALSNSRDSLFRQPGLPILYVFIVVVLQHLFYLSYNFLTVVFLMKLPVKQAISVVIMTSQKSNPVALAVISGMGVSNSVSGILVIPGLLGQLSQIFVGSFLAPRLEGWINLIYSKKKEKDSVNDVSVPKGPAEILETRVDIELSIACGQSSPSPPDDDNKHDSAHESQLSIDDHQSEQCHTSMIEHSEDIPVISRL